MRWGNIHPYFTDKNEKIEVTYSPKLVEILKDSSKANMIQTLELSWKMNSFGPNAV